MKQKVYVLGDSIAKGIVYVDEKLQRSQNSAISILEKELDIQIINLSAFGQTLPRICEKKFIENIIEGKGKDVVVFSIGGNDSDYNWKEVAISPNKNHIPKTPISQFYNLLDKNIKKLKKNNYTVILVNLPPIHSARFFSNFICKQANGDAVLKFLQGDITNIYRHQEAYNNVIVKCGNKNNCTVVDIRTPLLLNRHYSSLLCDDGIHPNEKGQALIAKIILKETKLMKNENFVTYK
ncbi:MAG: SGNH/GDSL hydrolase family protein [Clostridia bacterium]